MNKKQKRWTLTFIFITLLLSLMQAPHLFADQVPREQSIAGKTFVYRNGVWIDSTYEPSKHPVYQVGIQSSNYRLLEQAHPSVQQFNRLGTHYLVVLDSWAIEVKQGRDSGPLVTTEKRRPAFLKEFQEPEPIITTYRITTDEPTLLATTPSKNGFHINFHMSWGELIGLLTVVGLLGIGIWQNRKEDTVARAQTHLLLEEE